MYYWGNKEALASQAKLHVSDMREKYGEEIQESVGDTRLFEDLKPIKISRKQNTNMEVVYKDMTTVEAIINASHDVVASGNTLKVAALNFASYKRPGGRFLDGSSAQEESLCRNSTLYNVLNSFKDSYYDWNKKHLNGGLYHNRALYSPNIIFSIAGDIYKSDIITCAAPNWLAAYSYGNKTAEENTEALKSRIRFVLEIAANQEVDILILGAYGCGVFRQNPWNTAEIFMEELKKLPVFKKVVFAVPTADLRISGAFRSSVAEFNDNN